jgi:hypothetical protein
VDHRDGLSAPTSSIAEDAYHSVAWDASLRRRRPGARDRRRASTVGGVDEAGGATRIGRRAWLVHRW